MNNDVKPLKLDPVCAGRGGILMARARRAFGMLKYLAPKLKLRANRSLEHLAWSKAGSPGGRSEWFTEPGTVR